MTDMMKNIRKFALALAFVLAGAAAVNAQSMSDEQVMQYVMTEYNKGTSQTQIVTQLMQKGVDISQIRRVRQKYERQVQNGGLGVVDVTGQKNPSDRMRKNNGKDTKTGGMMQQEHEEYLGTNDRYSASNPNFVEIQNELTTMLPDTTLLRKGGRRVFGRDIFNNKELTFEPNMNIATPQN